MGTKAEKLLEKVIRYNDGVGEYNFSDLSDYDRNNASFDAWKNIEEEIRNYLNAHPSDPVEKEKLRAEKERKKLDEMYPEYCHCSYFNSGYIHDFDEESLIEKNHEDGEIVVKGSKSNVYKCKKCGKKYKDGIVVGF
jgi:rubrerythrin